MGAALRGGAARPLRRELRPNPLLDLPVRRRGEDRTPRSRPTPEPRPGEARRPAAVACSVPDGVRTGSPGGLAILPALTFVRRRSFTCRARASNQPRATVAYRRGERIKTKRSTQRQVRSTNVNASTRDL